MFSLAGVTEEGGKWQEVGWGQAVWGISNNSVCTCMCVYVCYARACMCTHTLGRGEGHVGDNLSKCYI